MLTPSCFGSSTARFRDGLEVFDFTLRSGMMPSVIGLDEELREDCLHDLLLHPHPSGYDLYVREASILVIIEVKDAPIT
jgi:hypothetical protein